MKNGTWSHTLSRMKTTIEIDEPKLLDFMELTGIKTRREAIDYALTEAGRQAKIQRLLERTFTPEELADSVDPNYDLMALREREKPRS